MNIRQKCLICALPVDDFAGNPSQWSVALPAFIVTDDEAHAGKSALYHVSCIAVAARRGLEKEAATKQHHDKTTCVFCTKQAVGNKEFYDGPEGHPPENQ